MCYRLDKSDSILTKYGKFISCHPWEIIVLSIVSTSVVMMICFPHSHSITYASEKSEWLAICIVKMLAVINVYIELRKLTNIPQKFIIGFMIIATFLTSFTFASAAVSLFSSEVSSLNKAMPFLLVLVDISQPNALVMYTFNKRKSSLAKAITILGPSMIKNAIVEAVVIGSGFLIGNNRLVREICLFGSLLVLINTIAFLSFFASCLSIISEIGKPNRKGFTEKLADSQLQSSRQSYNLRIHFIISILVLFASQYDNFFNTTLQSAHYSYKIWRFSLDDFAVIVVIFCLVLKYFFYDAHHDLSFIKIPFFNNELEFKPQEETRRKILKSPTSTSFSTANDLNIISPKFSTNDLNLKNEVEAIENTNLSLEEIKEILFTTDGHKKLTDQQILLLLRNKLILSYKLESILGDYERAISIRRQFMLGDLSTESITDLPYINYGHYNIVDGACCENVVGFMPVPLGVCGPLLLDGVKYMVPLATTEGCLVASVNRGMRALTFGVTSVLSNDEMTRAPVVKFDSVLKTNEFKTWLEDNFQTVADIFSQNSRFCRLKRIFTRQAGRLLYIRFSASTGDAMGMNMISKCAEVALKIIKEEFFPTMRVVSLSGNFCSDKKSASINWIEGRGKSVVCEAVVPASVVSSVLKTSVESLVELNEVKNLIGSSLAGAVGGFNAHAANIVTALYIATGQDPAQNISSSNCLTLLEFGGKSGEDLLISCSMPSIECGTVGGGTILPPQKCALNMMGVAGARPGEYGSNARQFARIVCASVLAGELSLLSALSSGHLVQGHMRYNRSQANINLSCLNLN